MHQKSSESINSYFVENMIEEYKEFLTFLEEKLDCKNISKTKLQKLYNKLNSNSSYDDICLTLANIKRFSRVRDVLENQINNLNLDTLKRMIAGSENSDFYSDSSEDAFFEFDFANRLLKCQNYTSININTEADIIFNDDIAIECKKLHSDKSFEKNISKANSQINKRIVDNLAKRGIIALDLTNLFNHNNVNKFFHDVYSYFHKEYTKIHDKVEPQIILFDENFKAIIQGYASSTLEFSFNSMFEKSKRNILFNEGVMGIFFQAETFISIPNNGPLIGQRIASYYINDTYFDAKNNPNETVKDFFHSLATGI